MNLSSADLARLGEMFRLFADSEFSGYPTVYTAMSRAFADRPDPAAPLLTAPPAQQRVILFFAAVHYLLYRHPDHPLARYYPSLGGDRVPDGDLAAAFTAFARQHSGELAALCADRTTQTNEARRTALLRPALGLAADDGRPLALVELGSSAGLLLLPDRYAYRYTGAGRAVTVGRRDAAGALVMGCVVRGVAFPEPVYTEPAIGARIGLDLHPVSPADPEATAWLRACVWPEDSHRRARLDAALAEAALVRPTLVRGDMVATLPDVLAAVDDDHLPVVFSSNAVTYLTPPAQTRLVATLAEVGARRDLAVVLNETTDAGVRLFDRTTPFASPRLGTPVYVRWRAGTPTVTVLGETAPHAQWLSWAPTPGTWRP